MEFLQKDGDIQKHGDRLPHWQQGRVPCFVTWRLGDALPQSLLRQMRFERQQWVLQHPRPWDVETERQYHHRFGAQVDRWLDAGFGSCLLRVREHRDCVEAVLRHGDGTAYQLWSFVIMPNHVHVLFSPDVVGSMSSLLKTWKSVSARRINCIAQRSGSLWQHRYWDRLIRSPAHFLRVLRYIERNPEKASLSCGEYTFAIREGLRAKTQGLCP